MNLDEQITLHQSMHQTKLMLEQQIRDINKDLFNLKAIIIKECPHINITSTHQYDGHKSTIIRRCNYCNFYV